MGRGVGTSSPEHVLGAKAASGDWEDELGWLHVREIG